MTDEQAEHLINRVWDLRRRGIKNEEELITTLQKEFNGTDDSFRWVLEMINTGGFRASIMCSGKKYPKGNLNIESNPILKNAFRMYWIDLRGEDHYRKFYLNRNIPWWIFWKRK
jgi:hypothetical protein